MKLFSKSDAFRRALSTLLFFLVLMPGYAIYVEIGKYTYDITRFWGSGVNGDTQAMIVGIASGERVSGNVVLPDSITYNGERYPVVGVGEGDFSGILEGVDPAFYKNDQITSITIPSTIRFIASNEFLDCHNIENYYVASDNQHFIAEGGILYELNYSYDQQEITYELFRYPSARRTTALAIPGKASRVGAGAFAANDNLKVIILSGEQTLNSMWQLGNHTIENVDCKSSTKYSQPEEGILTYGNTFIGVCPALNRASYSIPENLRYISEGAFCESVIREVTIPASIVNPLAQYEFMNSAVEKINFNGELPFNIPQGCFINAKSLASMSMRGDDNGNLWLSSSGFLRCKSLETITFDSSVKTIKIGRNAFMGCINLKEFPITSKMKISELDSYAFKGCRSLTGFSLANVEEIENVPGSQFEESGLTYVNWPSNFTQVPYGCFKDCRDLTKVNLKMTTSDINSDAFAGSGLTAISLMGVEWYGNTSFYNCPNLSRVYFPLNDKSYVYYRDFDFIPETCEVIINNPNVKHLDNQRPSEKSTVKLYSSIFYPSENIGDGWNVVYAPGRAKEIYKSFTNSEVREMYKYYTDKENSRVRIGSLASGVRLVGVVIEGVEAELIDGWWQADCEPKEGTKMNVTVNYTVYGNHMSTSYEYQYETEEPEPKPIVDKLYVVGDFNGWSADDAPEMSQADGKATMHFDSFETNFKIIGQHSWGDLEFGAPKGELLTLGTPMTLASKGNNDNIVFADGVSVVTDCTLSLDIATMALTVTGTPDNGPLVLYVSGSFQSPAWATPGQDGTQIMTANGDVYTVVCTFNGTAEAPATFKIASKGWGVEYGATEDTPVFDETTMTGFLKSKADGGNLDIKVALTGDYTVTFNAATLELALYEAGEEGINNVTVENNAEVVYYNLQGVRVDNPKGGIFIVKRGNDVSKVLVK